MSLGIKNTKKNLSKIAGVKFTLFQIKEDGSRGTQYGGLSGIKLIEQMSLYLAMGFRVVMVEDDKAYDIIREIYGGVMNDSQRDTEFYDKVKKFGVRFSEVVEFDQEQ